MRFAWHPRHPWHLLRGFVAVTLALLAGAAVANDCAAPFTPAQAEAALNAWRARGARCGLKHMAAAAPLKWDARLAQVAQSHSLDMAKRRQLTHAGSDGSRANDRLARAGYEWGAVAENIARGQPDLPTVMGAWARSAGHCRNAMEPQLQHMGLACVQTDDKTPPFWTLVLAAPLR